MPTSNIGRVVTALLLTIGLVAGLAGSSHAEFVVYDDFASGDIDPEKWSGFDTEGTFAAPSTELVRDVESGALRVALVSWGGDSSDAGSVRSRQGLNLRQLSVPGQLRFIRGLGATVTVHDAQAQDCTSNPETSRPSRSRAQIIGGFFNDGSGGVDDRTGDILAFLQMQKERDGQNRIAAGVNRCVDATCSSSVAVSVSGNPRVFTTTWTIDTPLALDVVWDPVNGKFTFTVTNPTTLATESYDIVYAPTVVNAGAPVTDFKSLRVENDVENCTAGRKRTAMDAHFDDVKVLRDSVRDFNGDGEADILWRNPSTGNVALWLMNGGSVVNGLGFGNMSPWSVAGVGDLNGDGMADILWRNTSTGDIALWLMNGGSVLSGFGFGNMSPWVVAGVGDFNGDGKADILWRNASTGSVALWLMNGGSVLSSVGFGNMSPWVVDGIGDLNGDGKADILWRNTSTGNVALWLMNGGSVLSGFGFGNMSLWVVAGVGDLNGDGKADILWRNTSTGNVALWLMNGGSVLSSVGFGNMSPWVVDVTGDFNGDGKADILWRNASTGNVGLWLMNGDSVLSSLGFGNMSPWIAQ